MDLFSAQTVLCIASLSVPLVLFLVFIQSDQRHTRETPSSTKKKNSSGLLGILPEYIKNRHRFLDWLTEALAASETQNMLFLSPTHTNGVVTANPSTVEYILKTNFSNYPRGRRTVDAMEDFLGHGIFNADGERWRVTRKTAALEFNKRSLRSFVAETVRSEITGRLLPLLDHAAAAGDVFNLQETLERFAFDNICKVAFDVDPACLSGEGSDDEGNVPEGFMRAFDNATVLSMGRFYDALEGTWKLKRWLNIGSERRLRESIKLVHDYAIEIIRSRKAEVAIQGQQREDLLSRFMSCSKDMVTGDGDEEHFLRDIVVSFLVAGRETTSTALSWFFWLLSSHPDVESKILNEIRSARAVKKGSDNKAPTTLTLDELREMHYLHAAITEALRLYPPVPLDVVECAGNDVLPDGTKVMKGWWVMYSAYAMGRMESIWGKDCHEYKPERWLHLDEAEDTPAELKFRAESAFKFPVFHAGPRMCLGKDMAYIQMKSVATSVLERFHVEVPQQGEKQQPEHQISITLKMKHGLHVKIRTREGS